MVTLAHWRSDVAVGVLVWNVTPGMQAVSAVQVASFCSVQGTEANDSESQAVQFWQIALACEPQAATCHVSPNIHDWQPKQTRSEVAVQSWIW